MYAMRAWCRLTACSGTHTGFDASRPMMSSGAWNTYAGWKLSKLGAYRSTRPGFELASGPPANESRGSASSGPTYDEDVPVRCFVIVMMLHQRRRAQRGT